MEFTAVAHWIADCTPLTGTKTLVEAFLDTSHPAPNSGQQTSEGPAGTYKIGPVKFDASGQWTVRFHFYEQCADAGQASLHGHAAFFVHVP